MIAIAGMHGLVQFFDSTNGLELNEIDLGVDAVQLITTWLSARTVKKWR
jgi:hypothetical protein